MRELMPRWVTPRGLFQVLKACFMDGVLGGLDRHGNNIIVLNDLSLITIDDEDMFYPGLDKHGKVRVWIKFDRDIKRLVYMNYLRQRAAWLEYVQFVKGNGKQIIAALDCPVMRDNKEFQFFKIVCHNVKNMDAVAAETVRQLLL